jgi:chromosome segregation ATPase
MSKPLTHTFGSAKYVYASAYDQLEADNDRVTKYSIAMSENMAELQDRLSDAEFNLETSRQYAIGMSKNIAQLEADNATLREQLAKADQHIKLHCSSLVNSIIRDSNKA